MKKKIDENLELRRKFWKAMEDQHNFDMRLLMLIFLVFVANLLFSLLLFSLVK